MLIEETKANIDVYIVNDKITNIKSDAMVATINRDLDPGVILQSILDLYGNRILKSIKQQN